MLERRRLLTSLQTKTATLRLLQNFCCSRHESCWWCTFHIFLCIKALATSWYIPSSVLDMKQWFAWTCHRLTYTSLDNPDKAAFCKTNNPLKVEDTVINWFIEPTWSTPLLHHSKLTVNVWTCLLLVRNQKVNEHPKMWRPISLVEPRPWRTWQERHPGTFLWSIESVGLDLSLSLTWNVLSVNTKRKTSLIESHLFSSTFYLQPSNL